MPQSLRVLIAEDDGASAKHLEGELRELGHTVVGIANDGASAVSMARALSPDLIILGAHLPGLDGAGAAERIHEERPVPVVLRGDHIGPDLADRIARLPVFGMLPHGASSGHVDVTLAIAFARHDEWRREQIRAEELQQRLEDRKVIERAKGILMQREGLSESDAYRMLQRTSQSRNVPMAELSRSLLAAEELISPPGRVTNRRTPPANPAR
ncbi:MAG TPA: ANTAR domain-containing protein [Gemmatimonadaceae bacterium]|nr:ANTAR domain-containing protein [Gemmatimonadaceae bacterium]